MLRTATTKKNYKIPINPPKKYKKSKKTKNTSDNEEKSKYNSEPETQLNIFAANANGLQGKEVSLKHEVNEANASIFCIQETKFRKKGRFVMENFVTFEAIRKNKEKGGTIIGLKEKLKPVLIEKYSDTFELIVVEIKVEGKEIRVMTGYGPQENWETNEKMPFLLHLRKRYQKQL